MSTVTVAVDLAKNGFEIAPQYATLSPPLQDRRRCVRGDCGRPSIRSATVASSPAGGTTSASSATTTSYARQHDNEQQRDQETVVSHRSEVPRGGLRPQPE
jgi:hypothetical protein